MPQYVIGVDYGTDSVRAILVDTANGEELASSVFAYPRWKKQMYCDASRQQFRQHPLDYIEGLEHVVNTCVETVGATVADQVVGLSIDTTGSTPVAVNEQGVPLSLLPGFEHEADAMFVLWKDHTATVEAAVINEHAKQFETNYLQYVGGIYSSEWFWAKLLRLVKSNKAVAGAMYTWVEQCDWLPFMLCGGSNANAIKRGVCSAGHKGLYASEFGGYPPASFFHGLHPQLADVAATLPKESFTAAESAGRLSKPWAERLNLPEGIVVGIGAFDAHMGAVGGEIEPYYLSKVMGTSTCDMLVAPATELGNTVVKGICGQVAGSVIPGMIGLEAGQSAFGDVYAWLRNVLVWPAKHSLHHAGLTEVQLEQVDRNLEEKLVSDLSDAAAQIELNVDLEYAVDWLNGRRTPDANQQLKGSMYQLHLGTTAPHLFRALAEATCFGAKAIVERFQQEGVPVKGIIGLGGVARKSAFIMQMMADVLQMPIRIHRSEQTCALGAAMFAATAAGVYANVEEAMKAMGSGFDLHYQPNSADATIYAKRYEVYKQLGANSSNVFN